MPYDWEHLAPNRVVPKGHRGFCSLGTAALAVIPTPMEKTQLPPLTLFTPHEMPTLIPTPTFRLGAGATVPTVKPKLMATPMERETGPWIMPPRPSETPAESDSLTYVPKV